MGLSIGTTYEGKNFSYLQKVLPFIQHIEISPDAIAWRNNGVTTIIPQALDELKWLQTNSGADLLVHGISLSIGSYDGYSAAYIGLLDELFGNLCIKWHSEHLAYTTVDGQELGTMLTLPRTDEVVDMICRRVDAIQQRYRAPFLLENVTNILPAPQAQYSEAGFLNRIAGLTGCGLVLDMYNLECDAHNFGLDVTAFLAELDLNNVYEMHLASGQTDPGLDFMMDIHAGLTAGNTIALAEKVIKQRPAKLQAVTFEILEEFIEKVSVTKIIEELKKLDNVLNAAYETANAAIELA